LGGILGITGTPGTGKKSIAPLVARLLGTRAFSINDLALSMGLSEVTDNGTVIDTEKLKRRLSAYFGGQALVYGHLLPYVLRPDSVARVAVLRCDPAVLKQRLTVRRYPPGKVLENVEAELIGLVSADTFKAFGESKTFEVDTTDSTPSSTAESVASVARGKKPPGVRIDWTPSYDSGEKLRSLLSAG
jgi:adenylate kinase